MLFNQLINLQEDYTQKSFNINQFINRAQTLLPGNVVINNTISHVTDINQNLHISRANLIEIWENTEIPFYSKILITFWWGGLSNQNQAPKFYTEANILKLYNFEDQITEDFRNANLQTDNLHANLKQIYTKFKLDDYKLAGIDTAFFTKILQFGIHNNIQPIIIDRWSANSILANMISTNFNYEAVFRMPKFDIRNIAEVKLKGSPKNEFNQYWTVLNYFNSICNQINEEPLRIEEIMFGFGSDLQNQKNPRVIANNLILNHIQNDQK